MAVRDIFLSTSRIALDFISSDDVRAHWEGPSALPEFSLRGLIGHLYRATGSVEAYLDRDEPEGPAIDAATYYNEAVGDPVVSSDLHRAVRARGEEAAADGPAALIAGWDELLQRMEQRLEREAPDRTVRVFGDLVLSLDDYLVTRLVELVVHTDDVAVSLGVEAPELPEGAFDAAIGCLVQVARLRHGDMRVVRALARRERDDVQAARVL